MSNEINIQKDTTHDKACAPSVTPMVFINEVEGGYAFSVELPGVEKDDIDLHIEQRKIKVKARNAFAPPEGMKCVRFEFNVSGYAATLNLPNHADPATVSAKFANGVLTISAKRKAESEPKKIDIAVA